MFWWFFWKSRRFLTKLLTFLTKFNLLKVILRFCSSFLFFKIIFDFKIFFKFWKIFKLFGLKPKILKNLKTFCSRTDSKPKTFNRRKFDFLENFLNLVCKHWKVLKQIFGRSFAIRHLPLCDQRPTKSLSKEWLNILLKSTSVFTTIVQS